MKLESSDLLFSERLAPITTSMGFVDADIQSFVDKFTNWRREIASQWDPKSKVEVNEVEGDLDKVFETILPLQRVHFNRCLFIPTKSNWTAYVDNSFHGTDPSAIGHMARLIGCRTLWMVARPHTLQKVGVPRIGRQGALIFELYGPKDTDWLNHIRVIRLENNAGRWEFSDSGDPLPFEDIDQYRARRVSERFSFETFTHYLEALGIHPFSSYFYLTQGAGSANMVQIKWRQRRLIRNVSFKRARRLTRIEDGVRIRGRLISREGYF